METQKFQERLTNWILVQKPIVTILKEKGDELKSMTCGYYDEDLWDAVDDCFHEVYDMFHGTANLLDDFKCSVRMHIEQWLVYYCDRNHSRIPDFIKNHIESIERFGI